ncbi:MAG: UDP-galactopyranose mutase [Acidobacteriaceae bacterium]|jgi:UDP-galactopyranose mutase
MQQNCIVVVGAGFAGSVCARELADAGLDILLIDCRSHIGGNTYDELDAQGLLVHRYGPHIFHTNSQQIVTFLSRFTEWRPYEHRVLAFTDGEFFPIPINRTTINRLYRLNLSEAEVAQYLEHVRRPRDIIRTSEDVVLSSVGHELCDKFFRGYSRKHWGLDLSELKASVLARIPTRSNDDDRYFTDTFQSMPKDGYTRMFERMLDHPRIKVMLNTSFEQIRSESRPRHTVYTGPVDAYFNYCFGALPYRSVEFVHEYLADREWFQPVGTVNYPNDHDFSRITEFKHLSGQTHPGTSIVREYPRAEGEPYYPIPTEANERRHQEYRNLVEKEPNVTFVGRLAEYRYYNMDQVVGAARTAAVRIKEQLQ